MSYKINYTNSSGKRTSTTVNTSIAHEIYRYKNNGSTMGASDNEISRAVEEEIKDYDVDDKDQIEDILIQTIIHHHKR